MDSINYLRKMIISIKLFESSNVRKFIRLIQLIELIQLI